MTTPHSTTFPPRDALPKPRATILVTGSSGLIGSDLRPALHARDFSVRGLDICGHGTERGDVCDSTDVESALDGVDGVVHLAAVSRVVWGERDPGACWRTNVGGLRNVLDHARRLVRPPWLIFASSREVYGHPHQLPVHEDAPLQPVNVYGRSKAAGEALLDDARSGGLRACVVRLSNVYGSVRDHADRVIPAFIRAALAGATIRVEGSANSFDFTHVDDTVRGLLAVVEHLSGGGEAPPPVQLVTARATTLSQLARLTLALRKTTSIVEEAPPRSFDVSCFLGSHTRATALFDWTPQVPLQEGLARLMRDFEAECATPVEGGAA